MFAIIEMIEGKPCVTLRTTHAEALEHATQCAAENMLIPENVLGTREFMIQRAQLKAALIDHGSVSDEPSYEVVVREVDDPDAPAIWTHRTPLLIIRNSMFAGPDRDRTLLDDGDYNSDGLPSDGDLYRICCDNHELAHWIDWIDEQLARVEEDRLKVVEMLDSLIVGTEATGRWLDENGDECDKEDEGAEWTEYEEELQEQWRRTIVEVLRKIKSII